jgi:hypothetical protein
VYATVQNSQSPGQPKTPRNASLFPICFRAKVQRRDYLQAKPNYDGSESNQCCPGQLPPLKTKVTFPVDYLFLGSARL